MFVEKVLDLSDGVWGRPGGIAIQFKSEDIYLRWYTDTKSITLNGKMKDEISEKLNSVAVISGKLANSSEGSKQDGHVEGRHVTSTLNINDSRDVNDLNRPFVDEMFKNAFNYLENEINELNSAFLKKVNDLERTMFGTKNNEQHLLISKLERANKDLQNKNQALQDKITNLSLIASDMNTKIKEMDNERLSLITALRLIQSAPSPEAYTEQQPFQKSQNKTKQIAKRRQIETK